MSSSLNILCPNGRRQLVKVSANTKILDIIEEVCKKQGYQTNEYDLIHQRKHLDVSLTFRLSGIPNNGQLELKKLENGPRTFQDVTIALQLEDGSRLTQQAFKPDSTSLLNVIEFYDQLDNEKKFSQVFNESLCYANETFPVISYLNEQIVGCKQLKHTTLKDLGLTSGRSIIRFHFKSIEREHFDLLNLEFDEKLKSKNKLDEIFERKKVAEQVNMDEDVQIMEPEPVQLRAEKKIETPIEINKREVSEPRQEKKIKLDYDIEVIGTGSSSNPPNSNRNEFLNFKFPEETKGQVLNDLNELSDIEKLSKQPCDRNPLFYNLEDLSFATNPDGKTQEELNDEFFDVTVHDLRYMLSDLKQRQNEEAPLMTKQMRELEQDRKAMKYSQIVIRIAFKSRLVLQGFFRPKENLSSVYDFVRDMLSHEGNDQDDIDFYLFSSPPKQTLNQMKSTLFESKLCPASLIYFKNKSDRLPQFKQFDKFYKTIREANELVYLNVHQTMRHIDHEGINWLQKEHSLVKNVLNNSSKESANQYIDYEPTSSSRKDDRDDDPVKKKLERFLKGSKK